MIEESTRSNKKRADKASYIAMGEMKHTLAIHKKDTEERIAECLSEQTWKHDEELNSLKQSQAAMNNLCTNHNPTFFLNDKTAEQYKTMTNVSDILFDIKSENWLIYEDHLI
jgi:hypothetical protein